MTSFREVELGIGKDLREVDEQGELLPLTRPRSHGLIPIPPEVEAVTAREEARLLKEHGITPTPEARRRVVDSLTRSWSGHREGPVSPASFSLQRDGLAPRFPVGSFLWNQQQPRTPTRRWRR
jgi:hypothetical protein